MQHCSRSKDKSRLCILRADHHSADDKPSCIEFERYRGDFSENGMGKIKVNGFILYGIGDEGSDEKEYHATVAHHYDKKLADIHFAVTWNTQLFLTVCKPCIHLKLIRLHLSVIVGRVLHG